MSTIPESLRLRRPAAAALAILLLLSLLSVAAAATVQGRVLFKNGAPASDIGVRLTVGAKVITPYSFSVRDGRFYLKDVPAGNYTLEIWKNRALVTRQPIVVREKITEVAAITLP